MRVANGRRIAVILAEHPQHPGGDLLLPGDRFLGALTCPQGSREARLTDERVGVQVAERAAQRLWPAWQMRRRRCGLRCRRRLPRRWQTLVFGQGSDG